MTLPMDTLGLKMADAAVKLSEFQQSIQGHLDSIVDGPLTFTPTVLSSVDSTVATKLQDLPNLIKHETSTSPTIQQLQSQTNPSNYSSIINNTIATSPTFTTLLQVIQDLQQTPRHQSPATCPTRFYKNETKDFHVSRLLKFFDTVTLATDSLQDCSCYHIQQHLP